MESAPRARRDRVRLRRHGWRGWCRQSQAPSWLISLVLHLGLMLALGFVSIARIQGTNAAPNAELYATFSNDPLDGEYFEDEQSSAVQMESDAAPNDGLEGEAIASGGTVPSDVFDDTPPVDASSALPSGMEMAGLGPGEPGQATGASGLTEGPRRAVRIEGGKARTKVYGIEGEGHKFLYVFDRSASMGGGGSSPLNSAKAELIASLEDLGDTNEFQIIFYNEKPTLMRLGNQPGALVFGNEQNKELARRFVRGITADGGTRHQEALELALKLRPDVLFFLTDADQPELSPGQLDRIRRRNGGRASIHTIEFGLGPSLNRDNFLIRLARQNNGKYVYIDISQRSARR